MTPAALQDQGRFSFFTVPAMICATGCSARIGEYCKEYSIDGSVLVITDRGLMTAGILDEAIQNLEHSGFEVTVFADVKPDPDVATIQAALQLARERTVAGVIGMGGGSSMDVAKLAALLAHPDAIDTLDGIYGVDRVRGKRLPLIQVPTTAGTGSEVTPISIVTTGESTKSGVVSRTLLADMTLLDPALTYRLPPIVTAATGIDAMVHALEAFTGKIRKNPISDTLALRSLRMLSQNIREAFRSPGAAVARREMLLGANLAGQAFANSPVGAVHALAYPLGGRFHIAHGISNALVLPYVIRFNRDVADHLYEEVWDTIAPGKLTPGGGKVDSLIDWFQALNTELLGKTRLREYGIQETDLPGLAYDAMSQTRLLVNNPRELVVEDALRIYREAF